MPNNQERRQYHRAEVKWPVTLVASQTKTEAEIENISPMGAFIACKGAPPLEENLRMIIKAPNRQTMSMAGRVVWSTVLGSSEGTPSLGVGVQFTEIYKGDRQFLRDVIAKHYARKIKRDTVLVRIRTPLNLRNVARALGTESKVLKRLNPQIRGHYLPTGHYTIKVPSGFGARMTAVLEDLTQAASSDINKISNSYYVVRPGDTLSRIAKRTGVSVADLKRLNGIRSSPIKVGQKLRLARIIDY